MSRRRWAFSRLWNIANPYSVGGSTPSAKIMDSSSLVTPLAETIGVLWKEVEDAGKTKEALLQFKDRLRALRIFIGNCDCPFLGLVLCNHMTSVGAYIDEHIAKHKL